MILILLKVDETANDMIDLLDVMSDSNPDGTFILG